jgi:hypothetical protein
MSRKQHSLENGRQERRDILTELIMAYTLKDFTEDEGDEGDPTAVLDKFIQTPYILDRIALFIYDKRLSLTEFTQLFETKPVGFENSRVYEAHQDETQLIIGFELRKERAEDTKNSKRGKAFLRVDKNTAFATLFTDYDRTNFQCIMRFFNKYYPFLSRIFFRSDEIRRLLEGVETNSGAKIVVTNYVLKRRYVRQETDNIWQDISYQKLFDRAAEDFLWVDSIDFEIEIESESKEEQVRGRVGIKRDGIIRSRGITYKKIRALFLDEFLSRYNEVYKIISKDRSISLTKLEPQPVKFIISEEIFRSNIETQKLIELIHDGLRNWGYSVLYNEQGSMYLLLHDYVSGSCFELLVVSTFEIVIIPKTQVTALSFNELVSFLMRYYDGELKEWMAT